VIPLHGHNPHHPQVRAERPGQGIVGGIRLRQDGYIMCMCRVDCVTFSINMLVQVDEATKNITEHSYYIGVIMEKRKTEARVMIVIWVKISFN
jgi:hypothetical protein